MSKKGTKKMQELPLASLLSILVVLTVVALAVYLAVKK